MLQNLAITVRDLDITLHPSVLAITTEEWPGRTKGFIRIYMRVFYLALAGAIRRKRPRSSVPYTLKSLPISSI
jgi:hypothetical protein